MFMEKRHFIILTICLLVVLFLIIWQSGNGREQFSPIQEWPYLPPNNWGSPQAKRWTPWWYEQNEDSVYPSVPSIANYDTDVYRFPNTNCLKHQNLQPIQPLRQSACGKPIQVPFAKYDINAMSNISDVEPNGLNGSYQVERFSSIPPSELNKLQRLKDIACGGCMSNLSRKHQVDLDSHYDGSCDFDTIEGFNQHGKYTDKARNLFKLLLLILIVYGVYYLMKSE